MHWRPAGRVDALGYIQGADKDIRRLHEEALRFLYAVPQLPESPGKKQCWVARHPAGGLCVPVLGSGNRDPQRFAEPEQFDLDEPTSASI